MLFVNDIFYSIQGESSFAGYPCKFVRLAGCNLKCSYCDTKEALITENSKKLAVSEIINELNKIGGNIRLAEITGGEPLIQEAVYGLFDELIKLNYTVLLETNGSIDLKSVPVKVIKIVDIKCPSSGFSHENRYKNLNYITATDELKFVIGTDEDYAFAKDFLKNNLIKTSKIIFSATHAAMSSKDLALKILKDELNVRLGIQLHKVLQLK
ncbi:MAG: radical SAM protein [Deltaproteobacteria bacterium]|jgi:7-carboxy-7-deazaguanine synthase|nr:radical SAM protein [Deltaproteobacteria bacterium]MCL5879270.1 radical SAM protein [Deltaproteobacteria bacterium]MDA8304947.1 radical SAM protein [Deltaproteobacteria bacterium]